MKSVNPKSPWLGRTEGPCSDAFQPKILRLKSEKNNTIYHHIFIRNALNADLRKMLRKHATNGNMPRPCPFSHFA
jgi:hypothetical protein